ncbi:hypothetical protein HC024_00170 [Methylococcaceae bacterium WWC4]|nr:hypothetical protein [Methylococcaceae bacterium WWC4]
MSKEPMYLDQAAEFLANFADKSTSVNCRAWTRIAFPDGREVSDGQVISAPATIVADWLAVGDVTVDHSDIDCALSCGQIPIVY